MGTILYRNRSCASVLVLLGGTAGAKRFDRRQQMVVVATKSTRGSIPDIILTMKFSSLALLAVLLGTSHAATLCDDYMAPITTDVDDNLEVPENAMCTLTNVVVTGDVKVKKSASLTTAETTMEKNVVVEDGATATITSSVILDKLDIKENTLVTILGDSSVRKIEARQGTILDMSHTAVLEEVKGDKVSEMSVLNCIIGKNLEAKMLGGSFNMADTTVNGDFKLRDSESEFAPGEIRGPGAILGDVEISDNIFSTLGIGDTLGSNGLLTIGDVTHVSNVDIEYNTITSGNLVVAGLQGNIKELTVKKNTSTESFGQMIVENNQVEDKIKAEYNEFSVIDVLDNCATDIIEVRKNEGTTLTCTGNKEFDVTDCDMYASSPTTITFEDNLFTNINGQCMMPYYRLRN